MRRIAVVFSGLAQPPDGESVLRDCKILDTLARTGSVVRHPKLPSEGTPELALLAVDPRQFDIAQGVLTVSALRKDPPQRSVCFHLTAGSLDENGLIRPLMTPVTEADVQTLRDAMSRLTTRSLVPLIGEGADHALVWEEGSVENATVPFAQAVGRSVSGSWPTGDGENALRRFIDDSVNILAESESNKHRTGEGSDPLSVLWPWGQGFWKDFPNLAVRRGEPVRYESASMRLDGLVRKFGYVHGDRAGFGRRLSPDYREIARRIADASVSVVFLENVADATAHHRWDVASEMLTDALNALVVPVASDPETRLLIVAMSEGGEGLALRYKSVHGGDGRYPFDERTLDERSAPTEPVWKSVEALLRA